MRTFELVGQRIGEGIRLVERFLGLRGEVPERGGMQIRAVVALREAVDEDLPVTLQLGLEFIHLMRPVEGYPSMPWASSPRKERSGSVLWD